MHTYNKRFMFIYIWLNADSKRSCHLRGRKPINRTMRLRTDDLNETVLYLSQPLHKTCNIVKVMVKQSNITLN